MKKPLLICTFVIISAKATFAGLITSPQDSVNYKAKPYVGIHLGSFGGGLQFAYPLSPMITLRATGSYLPAIERTIIGTEYGAVTTTDYVFKSGGGGIIADFSLFKNMPGIRFSAGAIYNGSFATAYRSYYLESEEIDLGNLTMDFSPKMRVNPYLGVVIGNLKNSKHLFFSMEMGALYQGKPQVVFTGIGHIAPTANESNTAIIENNVKSLQFYPYMNLQMNYKF